MLRRRVKPPPPGSLDFAAKRRRRVVASFFATVLVGLLLALALLMGTWLRVSPPLDPRWVNVPDAVMLVRLNTASPEGSALIRPPLEALHNRRIGNASEFESFWSSMRFLFHSKCSLWVISPGLDSEPPSAARTRTAPDFRWLAIASLKRRHPWIQDRVGGLVSRLGATPDETSFTEIEGQGPSPRRLVGGARDGALVLSTAPEAMAKVFETVTLTSKAPRDLPPPPPRPNSIEARLPTTEAPLVFVLRHPNRWGAPLAYRGVGQTHRPALDAVWPTSPAVFADAPWLAGAATLPKPDTLMLHLQWPRATTPEARNLQTVAVEEWIQSLNRHFAKTSNLNMVCGPLPREVSASPRSVTKKSPDRDDTPTGIVLSIAGWSALFRSEHP